MIYSEESSISLHARLGPNHGYSIEGDIALLHAEVAVPNDPRSARLQWALQLWACDAPHGGGPLSGVKVAEAALPANAAQDPLWLDTEALARVPGGLRDYSMVLVLASGEPGSVDQVHDFANYPQRQRFIAPHLEGSVGYRLEDDAVVLTAERVLNPRSEDNLSGSLELSLWAQPEYYTGGALDGTLVASADLGCIEGQSALEALEYRLAFNAPQAGSWRMVLALREWAGRAGYVTRDFCNFAVPHQVRDSEPAHETRASEPAPETRASEPAPEVRASEPVPEARASEPVLETRASEPVPETRASEPAHEARTSEPVPEARASEPAHEARTSEPVPEARASEAAHEARTSEPVPEVRASESAPEARASEPAPEARASEPAPEARTSEPAPEARTSEPAQASAEPLAAVRPSAIEPAPAAAAHTPSVEPAAVSRELRARQPAAAPKELRAPTASPSVASSDDRVSVSEANLDELTAVRGMNRKLAQGVVKARPFNSLDELIKVRGIGPKLLAALKPFLRL